MEPVDPVPGVTGHGAPEEAALDLVAGLADPRCTDPAVAGSKAASLAELRMQGFQVPPGVVLTTVAFTAAVGRLPDPDESGVGAVDLPAAVLLALERAVTVLGDGPLAVRSSAVAEDLSGSSFAGQHTTVLDVQGTGELVGAVRRCWASAFSAAALAYRRERSIGEPPVMAVLVQRQVPATAAGVAFTADPVSGDLGVTVVNAVAGLGEPLAAGRVTPEEWRESGGGGLQRSPGGPAVLSAHQAAEVARLARSVAAQRGSPQDVEWALEGDRLWLLQARPVTGLGPSGAAGGGPAPVPVRVEVPEGFWERDPSHFPDPVSPLQRSLLYPHAAAATPALAEEFGMLADGVELRDIGGWHYIRIVPFGGKEAEEPPRWLLWVLARTHPPLRRRLRAARRAFRDDRAGQVVDRWYREWMPELGRRIDDLTAVDMEALADDDLDRHLTAVVALKAEALRIHVLAIGAHMVGLYALPLACRELLGWDDGEALAMVAGLSGRSTEPSRQLAALTAMARDRAPVRELLEEGVAAAATANRLAEVDPEFAAAFERYRRAYGHRTIRRDLDSPTLAERPELLLQLLANQLATGYDPAAAEDENRRSREAAVARARGLLASRPPAERACFEHALRQAERAYPIREDNVFFTHSAPDGLTRYAALEMGRRMAQRGQLEGADDVFFLEYDELRGAFRERWAVMPLVERRQGERAWVLAHPGPPHYGTPPGEPNSLGALPAESRYTMEALLWNDRLDGGRIHPTNAGGRIRGTAASAGRYTGPARLILGEAEFGKLRAGDVVVCPTTSPTWSVLFPSMGALVTDSGGILNHPAIIAREYRIPAVVATGNATSLLHDGQLVTVDGSTGLVEVAPTGGVPAGGD